MSSSQTVKVFPKAWAPKWQRFFVAFFVSAVFFDLGHRLLGVRTELYWGIAAYDFVWVISMFLLPCLTGILVGLIYGWGGKLLAHFPPLFVLALHYYSTMVTGAPEGARLIPLMWWGFFVILNMEFSAVGGVIGELLLKRWYGTLDMPGTADYAPADSEPLPRDDVR
ncbi:MAG: hypothetical protein Q9M20_04855 [Mariprofundaceae bacterium]|nr:hypothetical protein [Mariprofundaceae bacterium]